MTALKPREPAPDLEVRTVGGGTWSLKAQRPDMLSMVVFYRGLHCPICKPYLRDLDRKLAEFGDLGVEAIALSTDQQDRAEAAKSDWGLDNLTVGYGVELEKAREWGLYVSSGIGKTRAGIEEPPLFNEPGLFLVRPDGTLYAAMVQTMPFARPAFDQILQSLKVIAERNYPARGEA